MRREPRKGRASARRLSLKAHAELRNSLLRLENGRILGPTLNDPQVKKSLTASKAELRKNHEKLRAQYIKSGLLTPGGKLTKAYGG